MPNESPQLGYSQGFATDAAGISTDVDYGNLVRVPSGTNGIVAPDGDGYFAIVTETDTGPFTRFGAASGPASSGEFVDGTRAEVSVYLDATWAADTSFAYSVAMNGPESTFQRDFVFLVRATGSGTYQVGAANGSPFEPMDEDIPGATVLNAGGWYTLQHVFNDVDGVLSVDFNVVAADGTVVHVATLSDPSDTIPDEVGGVRYGWFTDVSVPGGLAIDALQLGSFDGTVVEASTDVSTSGVIPFSDVDLADTHTVAATALGANYVGTFTPTVAADSTGDGHGSVGWTFSASAAQLDFLAAGQSVTQNYSIELSDGNGGVSTQVVTITLVGTNDAPVAVADVVTANEDQIVTSTTPRGLLANDTDVDTGDGANLTVAGAHAGTSVGGDTPVAAIGTTAIVGTYGTLNLAANGTYNYTPNSPAAQALGQGVAASDVFTYTVQDSSGGTSTSTLTVNIVGQNDGPQLGFSQGFATDAAGISTDAGYGGLTRVASGTNGIFAPDGDGYYAVVTETDTGPFTRFGAASGPASSGEFVDGTRAEVSVYLDATWAADTSFAYSVAMNGPESTFQRDFVFLVRATGSGTYQVGAANGTPFEPMDEDIPGATVLNAGGWYTLQHVFNDVDGVLSVDFNVVAADGTVVHVATLSDPSDTIPDEVGGVRYGWFTDVSVPGGLAIDALQLGGYDGAVVEGAADVTASGVIPFSDVDLTDTHTVSVTPVGVGHRGTLTATVADSTGDGQGSVSWVYQASAAQLDSLAAGQVVTQSYTLTLNDGQGGTSSQVVTITLTGTNDAPVVDLNGADAGNGYAVTYSEDGPSVAIGSGIAVIDPDSGDMVEGARVRLLNVQAGDVLAIAGTLPAGITASYATVGANYVLTLTGTASAAAYAAAIGQVRYSSTSEDPAASGATRTVDVLITDGDADSNLAETVITVISVDDPSVARPDAFTVNDDGVLTGNLLANNGFGADSDVDSPVESVRLIDGSRASIGEFFTLASGARLRVNADGTFTYDTNGAYTGLAAAGSGAVNTQATETFTYTLENGGTATVTIQINGVDNADFLQGTAASETLLGGVMDDTLMGGLGADSLVGGSGTDTVSYADDFGAVFVNLTLGVGSGNAAAGDVYNSIENVIGSSFNDTIIGEAGVNVLDGAGGDDVLIGALGADVLIGGSGSDTASYGDNQGSVFVNLSLGRGFNNAAEGDTYNGIENLQGSVFDDYLLGDDADNRLDGGMGADVLYGFGGADTFVFGHAASATSPFGGANVDTIADFVSGVDKIELSQAAYGALSLGTLSASAFTTGTAATSGDHRIVYNDATGQLYYDADGSGAGAAVLFAVLDTKPAITATDFIIAA